MKSSHCIHFCIFVTDFNAKIRKRFHISTQKRIKIINKMAKRGIFTIKKGIWKQKESWKSVKLSFLFRKSSIHEWANKKNNYLCIRKQETIHIIYIWSATFKSAHSVVIAPPGLQVAALSACRQTCALTVFWKNNAASNGIGAPHFVYI